MTVYPKIHQYHQNSSSEYSSKIHLFVLHEKRNSYGFEANYDRFAYFFILGWTLSLRLLSCERSTSERLNCVYLICVCINTSGFLSHCLASSSTVPLPSELQSDLLSSGWRRTFPNLSSFHWRFPPPVGRGRMDYGTNPTRGSSDLCFVPLRPPHTRTIFHSVGRKVQAKHQIHSPLVRKSKRWGDEHKVHKPWDAQTDTCRAVRMFDFSTSISQSLSKKKTRQGDQNDQLTVYT